MKPTITSDQLAEHLDLLSQSTDKDRDELLTDLICHVYKTLGAQNG